MKKTSIILAAAAAGLIVAGQKYAVAGLTYEGATVISETVMPDLASAFEAKTTVKFDKIGGAGADKGFKAVIEGKADIGGLSRALSREEKKEKPYYQTIGYDAIAIFVHEKNPVKNLSKEQLKGIFTGKITNWKEVGGKDAKITAVTEFKTGGRGTLKIFKELILRNSEFGATKELDFARDCVNYVATDENAISYASLCFSAAGTKSVALEKIEPSASNIKKGSYLLSRPLILLTKALPAGDVKKFFNFVTSAEGQAIMAKKFVPVK